MGREVLMFRVHACFGLLWGLVTAEPEAFVCPCNRSLVAKSAQEDATAWYTFHLHASWVSSGLVEGCAVHPGLL